MGKVLQFKLEAARSNKQLDDAVSWQLGRPKPGDSCLVFLYFSGET
jgi:hypothetical protein